MSESSSAVSHAVSVDWNVVAAALATFFGTACVTVWGLVTGKKKLEQRLEGRVEGPVQSAAILDNTILVQHVVIQREMRDHLLLNNHALTSLCNAVEENTEALDRLTKKLDG